MKQSCIRGASAVDSLTKIRQDRVLAVWRWRLVRPEAGRQARHKLGKNVEAHGFCQTELVGDQWVSGERAMLQLPTRKNNRIAILCTMLQPESSPVIPMSAQNSCIRQQADSACSIFSASESSISLPL